MMTYNGKTPRKMEQQPYKMKKKKIIEIRP